ncbi:MAG: CoA transferase subunit A [Acidimicrobiia bacterium]|nr:CoA transferase subunit A [Acidimicrobiia bacterium]
MWSCWIGRRSCLTEFTTLPSAIEDLVPDGSTVAMEGFTHLIPFAAGHEVIRQRKRDLALIRMTPDVIYDQVIGMGCASRLIFSWGGNPGVGSLHRLRDAVENGYPHRLDLEEHSHAGMATRYAAGASGLPFGILRGYHGTDLAEHTNMTTIVCPFTGEDLAAVPALTPDVALLHAQQADRQGNVGLWGISGVQKEVALASKTVVVTVEEVVDELGQQGPNHVVLPSWTVTAIVCVPRGSHPSYSMGFSNRDNVFYTQWDAISRDRDRFTQWMKSFVLDTDFEGYLAALDDGSLFTTVLDG